MQASVKEGQSAKDVVNDAADAMAEWESSMRTSGDEYGMSEAAARYVQAEDMLAKYLKLAGDVKTKISKRENYRKELDYYKSKQESLASKSSDSVCVLAKANVTLTVWIVGMEGWRRESREWRRTAR